LLASSCQLKRGCPPIDSSYPIGLGFGSGRFIC
jgi:hypothetical protein